MNFYLILGVEENADTETIKKAYRKLVKECHPDTHPGNRQAEERFKQISEAYAVLSDEEKRKSYDRQGRSHAEPKARRQSCTTGDFQSFFADTDALFKRYMGFK